MRTMSKWTVAGALAAVVTIGPAARADDYVAVFTLEEESRVGSVVLPPGSYAFRAVDGTGGQTFARVTSADETKRFAVLPILRLTGRNGSAASGDRLTWDQGTGRLLTWDVGSKRVVFYFPTTGVEPEKAQQLATRIVSAH
jgi:hypothetical protein